MTPREILTIILLILLIVCAIAVNVTRNLLVSVVIFMAYSSMMSVVWILMESPDLGITEAAVGAGISGTLFLMTLKKIQASEDQVRPAEAAEPDPGAAPSAGSPEAAQCKSAKSGEEISGQSAAASSEGETEGIR